MNRMWWVLAVGLALGAGSVNAAAETTKEMRKRAESSLLVTGTIDFDAQGRVEQYELKDAEKISPVVTEELAKRIPLWRFEPVVIGGQPRAARTRMSIRAVLARLGEEDYTLSFHRPHFFGDAKPGEEPASRRMKPPRYPLDMLRIEVSGIVYLALRFDRSGEVVDSAVEQVNLRIVAPEKHMERFRRRFSEEALSAARTWRFIPPTVGSEAENSTWTVRVPVDFRPAGPAGEKPDYEWSAYIPGPRKAIPWIDQPSLVPPDALAAGEVHSVRDSGIRLAQPEQPAL